MSTIRTYMLAGAVAEVMRAALPDAMVRFSVRSADEYCISIQLRKCGCLTVLHQKIPDGAMDILTPAAMVGMFARVALVGFYDWKHEHERARIWQHRWRPKSLDSLHDSAAR